MLGPKFDAYIKADGIVHVHRENGKRETETKCRVENSILQLEECYPALAVVKPCETSKIRPPLPLGSMLKMLLSRSAQKK